MDSPLEQLVYGTYSRAVGTFQAIVLLTSADLAQQGAMLVRPLFEDMVVAHWLVLHDDDPDWLIDRFLDHRDAMRLQEATSRGSHGWEDVDISDLAGREEALRAQFGAHAQRDRAGKRVDMATVVGELSAAKRFRPRLRGEEPVLLQFFDIVNRFATRHLHHTPVGLELQIVRGERVPAFVPLPNEIDVLFAAYWIHAQLVYLVLEVAGGDATDFERRFLHGLYHVFGSAFDLPEDLARP